VYCVDERDRRIARESVITSVVWRFRSSLVLLEVPSVLVLEGRMRLVLNITAISDAD
jgi:hypothetical protein